MNQNPLEPYETEEDYGFFDWVKKCFSHYADFSGRARRKEFWYFFLFLCIGNAIASVIDMAFGFKDIPVFQSIFSIATFVPNLAVTIRRLHDTNRSGWWFLINLIPLVGFIIFLVFMATDTKPESNQWGVPARQV